MTSVGPFDETDADDPFSTGSAPVSGEPLTGVVVAVSDAEFVNVSPVAVGEPSACVLRMNASYLTCAVAFAATSGTWNVRVVVPSACMTALVSVAPTTARRGSAVQSAGQPAGTEKPIGR
ncbi:hypothetical protein ACFP82_17625 [Cellulomonas gelida]|uniref:hypothetical protein n=1 Tax=Cellulomonas gelida TaxID=1712 RepID=UPI0036125161